MILFVIYSWIRPSFFKSSFFFKIHTSYYFAKSMRYNFNTDWVTVLKKHSLLVFPFLSLKINRSRRSTAQLIRFQFPIILLLEYQHWLDSFLFRSKEILLVYSYFFYSLAPKVVLRILTEIIHSITVICINKNSYRQLWLKQSFACKYFWAI